jgi:hypothetical protein
MRTLTRPLTLTLALAMAACAPATPPEPVLPPALLALTVADDAGFRTVHGHALAPAGVVARLITNDGAGLIGNDGAGLISNDGGSRHVESAGDRPLAGVRVWLTDTDGRPLAGIDPAVTGADGGFAVPAVPVAANGLVRVEAALADGRPTWLECPLDPTVPPVVDLASTLATAALRATGKLGRPVDGAAYAQAVATFEAAPPPGAVAALADPAAMGHLAAGIVLVPTFTPAPVVVQAAPVLDPAAEPERTPSPTPSLLCIRMQPKLGAPPTTICTPRGR